MALAILQTVLDYWLFRVVSYGVGFCRLGVEVDMLQLPTILNIGAE